MAAIGIGSAEGQTAGRATLVIGAEGTIPPLDPHRLTGTVGLRIIDAIYDPLVRDDLRTASKEAPALAPGLAESWTSSPDSKVFTFKLRRGVTFHDGVALDGAAVQANFDRIMSKDAPFFDQRASGAMSFLTRWIESTSAPDAATFVIKLKEPFADLPRLLTERRMSIVSPKALNEHKGDALAAHPAGTGPYMFDRLVQGQQLDLKRFDKYWGGQPKLDRIIFRQIPDPTTMATALQTGDIDFMPSAGAQQVEQLSKVRGVSILYPEPANAYYVRFNSRVAPTDNVEFRRALNYAVNRQAIATLANGQILPMGGPIPGGNEITGKGNTSLYTYDVEKAKRHLAASGVQTPVTLKLVIPTTGPGLSMMPQIAALIQQDWKAIGVNLQPQFLEFAAMIASESAGYKDDSHGSLNGWATGVETPYWLERMFSSAQHPPRGVNRGWYKNDQVDKLFDEARGEPDLGKRNNLYVKSAELIAADAPWMFLHQDRLPRVYRDRVTGLVAAASVYFDFPSLGVR